MTQAPLAMLLLPYFVCALAYSLLCGLLGSRYSPLGAFQVYALALAPALIISLAAGRPLQVWRWRRLWPPTAPETRAALSSVVILTASTLMYLSAQSLIAILVAQAGCLLLVARLSRPHTVALALLSVAAVALSVLHKPPVVALLPLALGLAKTAGYWWKIRSVESAKGGEGATRAAETAGQELGEQPSIVSPDDFLAAEQVLISIVALGVAALAAHFAAPAPLTDWRLWAVGAASLGMGLLGTRIMLRREEMGLTFPAYRMVSLVAAFGAAATRGEIALAWRHAAQLSAALLACSVVGIAALSDTQRARLVSVIGGAVRRFALLFQQSRDELAR